MPITQYDSPEPKKSGKSTPAKKKKRKKEHDDSKSYFSDGFDISDLWNEKTRITKNLGRNVVETAHGAPRAFGDSIAALGLDARDALMTGAPVVQPTRKPLGHRSKKIAEDVGAQYRHTYGPLFEGDYKEFYKRVTANPLGPILDTMTVATLGGGAVSRGGLAVARRAPEGSRRDTVGLKLAGAERRAVPEGSTAKAELDVFRGARRERKVGATAIDGQSYLVPRPRTIRVGEKVQQIGDVQQNAFRRQAQTAYDKIGDAYASAWIVGSGGRIERYNRRQRRIDERRDSYYGNAAEKIINRLEKDGSPEAAKAFADARNRAEKIVPSERVGQLQRDLGSLKHGDEGIALAAPAIHKLAKQAKKGKWHEDYLKAVASERQKSAWRTVQAKSAALKRAEHELKVLQDKRDAKEYIPEKNRGIYKSKPYGPINAVPENVRVSRKVGDRTIDAEQRFAELEAKVERLKQDKRKHEIQARAFRRVEQDGTLALSDDLQRSFAYKHREVIEPQMEANLAVQRGLRDEGLAESYRKPVNRLVDLLRENSAVITAAYQASGFNPDPVRAVKTTQRTVGKKQFDLDGAFPLSQHMDKTTHRAIQQKTSIAHGRKSRPDSSKFRSGFAYRFGLETLSPRNAVWTMRVAKEYETQARAMDLILASGRKIAKGEKPPKNWMRVNTNAKTDQYAENLRAFADEEAPMIFDDSPQLREIQDRVFKIIDNLTDEQSDWIVPKRFHNKVIREITPEKRGAVTKLIDMSIASWRTATVSALRQAFLTNNTLGASALLLMAHAPYKHVRYTLNHSKAFLNLEDDFKPHMAGITSSGQAAVFAKQTREMIGHGADGDGKIRNAALKFNEGLGKIGQILTDDPWRRIAFSMEVIPTARKLYKERNQKDPAYTFRDAVHELLDDEEFRSRVEHKVLGDLVDFEDLTTAERAVIRRWMSPFYSWTKGSSKLTSMWIANNPTKAAVFARMGQQGFEDNLEDWGGRGKVPHFLGGMIPAGKSGGITTASWNPLVTPADTYNLLGSFIWNSSGNEAGADNPMSQMPPTTKALAAFLANQNRDPFSGEQLPGDNRTSRALSSFKNSFPQVNAFRRLADRDQRERDLAKRKERDPDFKGDLGYILPPSKRGEWFKYLGVPYREVSRESALRVGDKSREYGSVELPEELGADNAEWTSLPNGLMVRTELFDPDEFGKRDNRRRRRRKRRSRG